VAGQLFPLEGVTSVDGRAPYGRLLPLVPSPLPSTEAEDADADTVVPGDGRGAGSGAGSHVSEGKLLELASGGVLR